MKKVIIISLIIALLSSCSMKKNIQNNEDRSVMNLQKQVVELQERNKELESSTVRLENEKQILETQISQLKKYGQSKTSDSTEIKVEKAREEMSYKTYDNEKIALAFDYPSGLYKTEDFKESGYAYVRFQNYKPTNEKTKLQGDEFFFEVHKGDKENWNACEQQLGNGTQVKIGTSQAYKNTSFADEGKTTLFCVEKDEDIYLLKLVEQDKASEIVQKIFSSLSVK